MRRGRPETAAQLRVCIADHLHADVRLKATVDAVLLCAYGAALHKARAQIPPRAAVVEVRVTRVQLRVSAMVRNLGFRRGPR